MAETLNLGTNGNWATKKESLLAYNSENNNFKPLPFNFTRSTSATRVNKEGLIEVVSNNEPRVDYKDDSKGALLLEPSRSNLVTYSEDFSDASWNNPSSVTSNTKISPSGLQNADTVTSTLYKFISATNGLDYTVSAFVKKELSSQFVLRLDLNTPNSCAFNLDTLTADSGGKIENYGNDWYRCSFTATATVTATGVFYLLVTSPSIYIYGAQLEQGSYATSYIPTQGSIGTRVAESCEQNLSNQVSLTEGVFYVDVTNLGRTQNANILTQNSTSNSVYGYIQTNNRITFGLFANSVSVPITSSLEYEIGTRTKIAFHYKSGNSKLYINGSLVGSSTDTFTLGSSFAEEIRLIDNASAYFAFPEKSILQEFKIYNTALTDQELINLTKI